MTSVRTKCPPQTGQHGAQRFTESPGITVPLQRRSTHYSLGPPQNGVVVGVMSWKRMAKLRASANILPEECSASEGVNCSLQQFNSLRVDTAKAPALPDGVVCRVAPDRRAPRSRGLMKWRNRTVRYSAVRRR